LKLAHTVSRWSREMALRTAKQGRPDKVTLQKELGGKLLRVFRPDQLGRLISRRQGMKRAEVEVAFSSQANASFKFSFATNSSTDVSLDSAPAEFSEGGAVFFPTKEVLSMFPWFAALYDTLSKLLWEIEGNGLCFVRPCGANTLAIGSQGLHNRSAVKGGRFDGGSR